MRFRLLGAPEVEEDGRPIRIAGRKLRTALAVLLLHPNEIVSRDAMIDAVWDGRPPPSAQHGLDVLVSRLRGLLGEGRLETRPQGHLLHVGPEELDVTRFESALRAGQRALALEELDRAVDELRAALDEWSGTALGDLAYAQFATAERARLEELRLVAFEELFEAELRRGRHLTVIADVESLVARHPFRERPRAQLMLALYRAGRQSAALETFRTGRRLLTEELGIEPGHELQKLHAAILRQDDTLEPKRSPAPTVGALPKTRYAPGKVAIAYQVTGDGPFDLVYAPPFVTNVELTWQVPTWAALLRRLGSFSRLIRFDKRGTGMSDRVGLGDLATVVDDFRAVMDAALSQEAAVLGASDAGALSILFAAAHPDRVWALVLWGATARVRWAEDYPIGDTGDLLERSGYQDERIWTEPGYAEELARSIGAADVGELAQLWRQSASPGAFRMLQRRSIEIDVRHALPAISVPTLILNREGDDSIAAGSRYLAEHIPGARQVVFPGAHHVMFAAGGDFEPIVREIELFLDDAWTAHVARNADGARGRAPVPKSARSKASVVSTGPGGRRTVDDAEQAEHRRHRGDTAGARHAQ